jgi:hydrogenase maturation protease
MTEDGTPTPPAPALVVIGVGNPYRGDDAVGHEVVRRLGQELGACEQVRLLLESGEGTRLMAAWQGAETAMLIDAVWSGAEPGTVHRFDAVTQPIQGVWWRTSTHTFGVAEAIALARILQELPARLLVYGIEGGSFAPGTGLSRAVAGVVPEVVAQLRQDIAACTGVKRSRPCTKPR